MRRTCRLLLCGIFSAGFFSMGVAQNDTTDYGGPENDEDIDLILETPEVPVAKEKVESLDLIWDVNDSLFLIPGYDLYCHWNTEAFFNNSGTHPLMQDSMRLYLSMSEHDHALPCPGPITSNYGARNGRMHRGVDIDLETGDPVVNAFSGMVRIARYNKSFGNVVVVRHYNGLETVYAHLSKLLVKSGQLLQAGDTIGLGGNTGRSFGSHLHFEVRFLDKAIDPALIFDLTNGQLKANDLDITKNLMADLRNSSTTTSSRSTYYTIRRGDTLSGISRKYGTSVNTICRLNGISKNKTLRPGQRIRCR